MIAFNKFVVLSVLAVSGVAASAHASEPRQLKQVLPVVSARGDAPALTAVRHNGHKHHHRRAHRSHPVRHVR